VIVERIAGDEVGSLFFRELGFLRADGGKGRIGEDDVEQGRFRDGAELFCGNAKGMAGGEFALGDGEVDDVVPQTSPPA
jgi:hypothetical protein